MRRYVYLRGHFLYFFMSNDVSGFWFFVVGEGSGGERVLGVCVVIGDGWQISLFFGGLVVVGPGM